MTVGITVLNRLILRDVLGRKMYILVRKTKAITHKYKKEKEKYPC